MNEKYGIAGAKESTPSIPEYFSWINNTNEGSTEKQTLINLEFFRYMKETYGMQINLYLWDAGNFDGANEGFGNVNSQKFKKQYPEEYKNVAKKASELGIRMGLWGSPDGFGNTPEEEKERVDFYVHLCRDYNFGVFKLDGVCGFLRPEKAKVFGDMIAKCREYCPDLVLQNHRLNFYESQKYITTFLYNGAETYTDVHESNDLPAMHNREYMFRRGYVEKDGELVRLAEDHGVCLSSCLDYFEDELIYQAFGRCLIIAPEIYGNPWFLKDSEYPRLARVYNLHRRHAEDLTEGAKLSSEYGDDATVRGTDKKRFIATGNDSWETKNIKLTLDTSVGLEPTDEKICVNLRHPYDYHIGEFNYGDSVEVTLLPFRATLIEIATESLADPVVIGAAYETVKETEFGKPTEIKILKTDGGKLELLTKGEKTFFCETDACDDAEKAPVFLCNVDDAENDPENGEELYENAMFAINNDSLEARCIVRSGDSAIPEVKAARDAFFSQETYTLRGCEASSMFDGNDETFFDGQSRTYNIECPALRDKGGCLRVDFGEEIVADRVEIECFSVKEAVREVFLQNFPEYAEFSRDLKDWEKSGEAMTENVKTNIETDYVRFTVHSIGKLKGDRVKVTYRINGKFRYMRIAEPMDRIYSVKAFLGDREIKPECPMANNLQAHYSVNTVKKVLSKTVTVPEYKPGSYIAVGVWGYHGEESCYAVIEENGVYHGCEGRAPTYKANAWEHRICKDESNTTFFCKLPEGMKGKNIKLHVLLCDGDNTDVTCRAYLCDGHN